MHGPPGLAVPLPLVRTASPANAPALAPPRFAFLTILAVSVWATLGLVRSMPKQAGASVRPATRTVTKPPYCQGRFPGDFA